MKIKNLNLIIAAFLAIIQTLELTAQDGNYSLMTRGQRMPFDTAVAINLPQYRLETVKFDICDSLIAALVLITDNQSKQIFTLEKRVLNLQELNAVCDAEIARKTKVNTDLYIEYQKLSIANAKMQKWHRKKWIPFSIGVAAGTATTYMIFKIIK